MEQRAQQRTLRKRALEEKKRKAEEEKLVMDKLINIYFCNFSTEIPVLKRRLGSFKFH